MFQFFNLESILEHIVPSSLTRRVCWNTLFQFFNYESIMEHSLLKHNVPCYSIRRFMLGIPVQSFFYWRVCWCTLFQVLSLGEFVGAPCSKSFSQRVCWCTLFQVLSLGEFFGALCSKFFLSESLLVHPFPSYFSRIVCR